MNIEANYGALDGFPIRYTKTEAWILVNGVWKWLHPGELEDMGVLSKEAFEARFGQDLVKLPNKAFQSGDISPTAA